MSTPNKVFSALSEAHEYISLGLQVGVEIVPLAKGLIKEIRAIGAPQEIVAYEILVQVDQNELDDVKRIALEDLAAINLELKVRGAPEIPATPALGNDAPTPDLPQLK